MKPTYLVVSSFPAIHAAAIAASSASGVSINGLGIWSILGESHPPNHNKQPRRGYHFPDEHIAGPGHG
jgi:hypothetical protein